MATGAPVVDNPLLTVKQVSAWIGMSVATIYRWIAENKFPEPVKLGNRSVRWPKADIEAWLSDQRVPS